jgi:hypothetical protein
VEAPERRHAEAMLEPGCRTLADMGKRAAVLVGDGDRLDALEALEAGVSGARPLVVSLRETGGFAFKLAS